MSLISEKILDQRKLKGDKKLSSEQIEAQREAILAGLGESLKSNRELMEQLTALVKEQLELIQPPDLVKLRKKAETGEWVPYEPRSFSLTSARTDESIVVEGDYILAWTDGSYEGISLKLNNLNNAPIYLHRQRVIPGIPFWRIYLTNTVQSGKTLELFITRGLNALAEAAVKATVRAKGGLLNSGVKSADALIKTGAGAVYWMTVSDTAALAVELNDSLNNTGVDRWGIDLPAAGYAHFIFDPPLEFSTGIYLDVSTATCKITIGFS